MRQRLHVKVSRQCNNHCLFCLDDTARRTDVTAGEVEDLLGAHRDLGEVLFTCGEPTLHPELPRFVERARAHGYGSIGLVTNGRRLSYRAYAESLVRAGLTEVTVSIHGHEPRMHDPLTRTRGAFEQTVAGLRNAVALRRVAPLRVISSTVLVRHNVPHVRAILDFLDGLGVDVMVLNVVEPSGTALQHYDRVAPDYQEFAGHLGRALADFPGRGRVAVEGMPVCLCRDFIEVVGVREEIHLQEGGTVRALPPDRAHVKPGACDACRWTDRCPGVFREYVERRGAGELSPER